MVRILGATVLICLLSGAAPATGDAQAGRQLAQTWCSACHAIGAPGTATDAAPSWPAVAEDYRNDPDALRAWLLTDHPQMPNFDLSRSEIEDLVAYFATLAP
jgi:mono/diheme cytochrome c family protein